MFKETVQFHGVSLGVYLNINFVSFGWDENISLESWWYDCFAMLLYILPRLGSVIIAQFLQGILGKNYF